MMTSPVIDDMFIHVFREWLSVEYSISFMQLFSVKSWLVFVRKNMNIVPVLLLSKLSLNGLM